MKESNVISGKVRARSYSPFLRAVLKAGYSSIDEFFSKNHDKTFLEMSDMIGMSYQAISRYYKKYEERIINKLKEEYYERHNSQVG